MRKRWLMLCLVGAILLCAGCGEVEMSPETPPPDEAEETSPPPEAETPPSGEIPETVDETDRVEVYADEEIAITVPAAYEDLVQVDSVGTDNLFVVSANLYYAPEYSQGEQGEFSDSPSLCGGWMLTVEWMPAMAARGMEQSDSFFATRWTGDGQCIYYENRPTAEYLETASPEFLAVLDSIQVDYGDLKPVTEADTAPYQ